MKQSNITYRITRYIVTAMIVAFIVFSGFTDSVAQPFPLKKGGIVFRLDNNPSLMKLTQIDSVFTLHNQKFSMAITSWIFPIAPDYVDALKNYSAKGHEVMDNTPTHQTQFINLLNPADTVFFIGKPGVDHITPTRVCLAYSAVDTSQSHNEGLINVFGNMVISQAPGEFGNLNGNPYFFAIYLNTIDQVCLWYNRSAINPLDPDTVFVQSFWEEPVNFGNMINLRYHKLTQVNVLMQPEAIQLLGERSQELFDKYGIPRPVSWIHPVGQMPMLDGYQIKANLGDVLQYQAGSNYINEAYLCYNEYNPYGIRQFGMQNDRISISDHTYAWNKSRIANAVAKHMVNIDIATLVSPFGGWNSYLARLDSLLSWCVEKNIQIGTYSQWKTWLYDSIPNRVANVFPGLNVDLDDNSYPDGFDQQASITGQYDMTDGVAFSGGRSFALFEQGTFCQITQLAGIEKGKNIFSIYLKNIGSDSSGVKARFTFPETGNIQELDFTADTSAWSKFTGMVTVPPSVTVMNVVILRTDTMPDTLKISGMGFQSAGFLTSASYPHQSVIKNEQFDRIDLYQLVIDTIYTPTTINWSVKGADDMTFRDLTSRYMLPLKPQSFWVGTDSAWLMAYSPDGVLDSCRMSFASLPLIGTCPGSPITITLLDTLENDFIQWTSIPLDTTLSDPNIYNPTANPSVTTLYKVTAINPQGPIQYDSLLVVRFTVPTPWLPPDTNICEGDSLILTVSGGGSYLWNTGDTTASIYVAPSVSTFYSVVVTNSFGCSGNASIQVFVRPAPEVRMFGLWPAYCVYDYASSVFGQPAGGVFSGPGLVGDIFYPDKANIGLNMITYKYSDIYGCSNSDTLNVNVYPKPSVWPQPTDTVVCADKSILLNAGPGNSSYLWSNGINGQSVVVDTNGIGLGDYIIWVYVTKDGCVNMDTAYINFIDCHIGIEEVSGKEPYRIYPNPAGEYVTIESLDAKEKFFTVRILDLRGKTILTTSLFEQKAELSLNGIPSGLYLLQVNGAEAVYRFRLIRY